MANFCIFFTNETLLQTINLLHIRSDLHPETQQLINQYTRDIQEIDHQIMDSLSKDQLAEMAKLFRICMNGMIDLHLKLITRSDFTLKIIDRLNSSIFVLYNKILFSQAPEIRKRECQENSKTIIKIGSYFLGLGLETKTASLFELAVLLL